MATEAPKTPNQGLVDSFIQKYCKGTEIKLVRDETQGAKEYSFVLFPAVNYKGIKLQAGYFDLENNCMVFDVLDKDTEGTALSIISNGRLTDGDASVSMLRYRPVADAESDGGETKEVQGVWEIAYNEPQNLQIALPGYPGQDNAGGPQNLVIEGVESVRIDDNDLEVIPVSAAEGKSVNLVWQGQKITFPNALFDSVSQVRTSKGHVEISGQKDGEDVAYNLTNGEVPEGVKPEEGQLATVSIDEFAPTVSEMPGLEDRLASVLGSDKFNLDSEGNITILSNDFAFSSDIPGMSAQLRPAKAVLTGDFLEITFVTMEGKAIQLHGGSLGGVSAIETRYKNAGEKEDVSTAVIKGNPIQYINKALQVDSDEVRFGGESGNFRFRNVKGCGIAANHGGDFEDILSLIPGGTLGSVSITPRGKAVINITTGGTETALEFSLDSLQDVSIGDDLPIGIEKLLEKFRKRQEVLNILERYGVESTLPVKIDFGKELTVEKVKNCILPLGLHPTPQKYIIYSDYSVKIIGTVQGGNIEMGNIRTKFSGDIEFTINQGTDGKVDKITGRSQESFGLNLSAGGIELEARSAGFSYKQDKGEVRFSVVDKLKFPENTLPPYFQSGSVVDTITINSGGRIGIQYNAVYLSNVSKGYGELLLSPYVTTVISKISKMPDQFFANIEEFRTQFIRPSLMMPFLAAMNKPADDVSKLAGMVIDVLEDIGDAEDHLIRDVKIRPDEQTTTVQFYNGLNLSLLVGQHAREYGIKELRQNFAEGQESIDVTLSPGQSVVEHVFPELIFENQTKDTLSYAHSDAIRQQQGPREIKIQPNYGREVRFKFGSTSISTEGINVRPQVGGGLPLASLEENVKITIANNRELSDRINELVKKLPSPVSFSINDAGAIELGGTLIIDSTYVWMGNKAIWASEECDDERVTDSIWKSEIHTIHSSLSNYLSWIEPTSVAFNKEFKFAEDGSIVRRNPNTIDQTILPGVNKLTTLDGKVTHIDGSAIPLKLQLVNTDISGTALVSSASFQYGELQKLELMPYSTVTMGAWAIDNVKDVTFPGAGCNLVPQDRKALSFRRTDNKPLIIKGSENTSPSPVVGGMASVGSDGIMVSVEEFTIPQRVMGVTIPSALRKGTKHSIVVFSSTDGQPRSL